MPRLNIVEKLIAFASLFQCCKQIKPEINDKAFCQGYYRLLFYIQRVKCYENLLKDYFKAQPLNQFQLSSGNFHLFQYKG